MNDEKNYTDEELVRMREWGGYSEPIKPEIFRPAGNVEEMEISEADRQKLDFVFNFLSDSQQTLSPEQQKRAAQYLEENVPEGIVSLGVEISQMPEEGVYADKAATTFGKHVTIANLGLGVGDYETVRDSVELLYSDGNVNMEGGKIEIKNANVVILGHESDVPQEDVKRKMIYVFFSDKYLRDYNHAVLQHNEAVS